MMLEPDDLIPQSHLTLENIAYKKNADATRVSDRDDLEYVECDDSDKHHREDLCKQ
jgi:hypothetical protein